MHPNAAPPTPSGVGASAPRPPSSTARERRPRNTARGQLKHHSLQGSAGALGTGQKFDCAARDLPVAARSPGTCDLRGVVPNHRSVIREWEPVSTSPLTFEPLADSRVLFTVDQPQANHNAGDMKFGPDGMLYTVRTPATRSATSCAST